MTCRWAIWPSPEYRNKRSSFFSAFTKWSNKRAQDKTRTLKCANRENIVLRDTKGKVFPFPYKYLSLLGTTTVQTNDVNSSAGGAAVTNLGGWRAWTLWVCFLFLMISRTLGAVVKHSRSKKKKKGKKDVQNKVWNYSTSLYILLGCICFIPSLRYSRAGLYTAVV